MSKDIITAVPSFRDTFDSLTDTRILSGLPSNAPGNKLYVNGLFGRTDPALRRIIQILTEKTQMYQLTVLIANT